MTKEEWHAALMETLDNLFKSPKPTKEQIGQYLINEAKKYFDTLPPEQRPSRYEIEEVMIDGQMRLRPIGYVDVIVTGIKIDLGDLK